MEKLNYHNEKVLFEVNYLILIAGSSPSSSSSSSVNPMASLGALQTLAGATAGLNVSSLAGKLCVVVDWGSSRLSFLKLC